MTKSEAISQLQERIDLINKDYFDLQLDKYAEALEMAIEALNQFAEVDKKVSAEGQDLISRQKDLISREVALTHIDDVPYIKDHPNVGLLWKAWIENLPSAQPEPLTDKEQRIFLAAMGREEKVCEEVDRNHIREPYEDSLMRVCKEIRRKVKGALWT